MSLPSFALDLYPKNRDLMSLPSFALDFYATQSISQFIVALLSLSALDAGALAREFGS